MQRAKLRSAAFLLLWIASAITQPALAGASPNLLVNGDAELHRCTKDWTAQTPVPDGG